MTVDKLSHESYSALEPQQNLNLAGPIGERARLLPLCLRALGTLRCKAHETDRESLPMGLRQPHERCTRLVLGEDSYSEPNVPRVHIGAEGSRSLIQ